MTSLIAWVGVDARVPASVYIATDSRLSNGKGKWDCGRKVFACVNSPNIFGYCGAVLLPSQLLGQLVQAIDLGTLFEESTPAEKKLEIIAGTLSTEATRFPEQEAFTIVYAMRSGKGFGAKIFAGAMSWKPKRGMSVEPFQTPAESNLICAYGSGTTTIKNHSRKWANCEVGRTSRAVFSAFCDAVASGKDPYTGGSPQLVGIYSIGAAIAFGVFDKGNCFLNGMKIDSKLGVSLECRNRLFERCDAEGCVIGQRRARPRSLQPKSGEED